MPVSKPALRWLVLIALLAWVGGQVAGEAVGAALAEAIEWLVAIGLVAAAYLTIAAHNSPSADLLPARSSDPKPTFRFSRIRLNALLGLGIISVGATLMHQVGVPEPVIVAFVSTGLMVLKDIVKGDQD